MKNTIVYMYVKALKSMMLIVMGMINASIMMDLKKILLGIFIDHVEIFGIIVTILLVIIGLCIKIFIHRLVKRSEYIEDLHDDILIVKMQDEGRKSFTNTLLEVKIKVDTHENRINHLENRIDQKYDGKDRRDK